MFSGAPNSGPEVEAQLKEETLKCVALHKQELPSGMQEVSVGGTGQPGRAVPTVTLCKGRSQQCTGSRRQGPRGLSQHGRTVHTVSAVGASGLWETGPPTRLPATQALGPAKSELLLLRFEPHGC